MLEVVVYKMLKTMENSAKAVILKSGRGRLQEVGIYESFLWVGKFWCTFLLGVRTWTFDRIFSLGSRVIEISMQQWILCGIDILQIIGYPWNIVLDAY